MRKIQISTIRQSVAQHLFYIQWYICERDIFRPSRLFSGPKRKQNQDCSVFLHCGIPNAHKFPLQKQKYTWLYIFNLLCDSFNLKLETYPV